jgi:hypothetical protein
MDAYMGSKYLKAHENNIEWLLLEREGATSGIGASKRFQLDI